MWGGLLALGAALAGPIADLAGEVRGTPVMVLSCDRAERVMEGAATDDLGLPPLADLDAEHESWLDGGAPLHLVVAAGEAGTRLALDVGVTDVPRVRERLEDPAFAEAFAEPPVVDDSRLQLVLEHETVFEPSEQPVPARAEAVERDAGCVVAVDVPAVLGGARVALPMLDRASVLTVHFTTPRGVHRVRVEIDRLPPAVSQALATTGGEALGVVSRERYPVVVQVRAGVREVLQAMAALVDGHRAEPLALLADRIPRRVRGGPGMAIALGGPDVGGALVIPMRRPRGPRRLLRVVRRVAKRVDAGTTKIEPRLWRIEPVDRPALTAGARRGLVVIALKEQTVRDVLAGRGEPWLPEAHTPWAVRLRAEPDRVRMLRGLDGYTEIRYEAPFLHLRIDPPEE